MLLIVDGHAYAYRAFYAIRSLRSPTGEATNAIFGFIKMLGKLRAALAPRFVLVVWDGGLSEARLAALPEYKAQRPAMPAELGAQIDEIVGYLGAAGVASYCRDGVEADDYIACVARRAARAGLDVVIASADKDFMQLVTRECGVRSAECGVESAESENSALRTPSSALGKVGLFNPNDKSETVWGAAEVRAKAGVNPEQIVDWLALIGDSVDNIPGVPGVGPKTATDLLNEFGTVEELYRRLGEVKSERLRGALASSEAVVRRNVELVRLQDDLECDFVADELVPRAADVDGLRERFERWGFRGMLAELEAGSKDQKPKAKVQSLKSNGSPTLDFGPETLDSTVQAVLL
ncbi:MAG: hypothetical protein EXS35_06635 [Pedosphaera sp.]|nr:hypothetical protein [Pedosphaera sp.]